MKTGYYFKLLLPFSLFSLFIAACSSIPQIQSERIAKTIIIDGDKSDWNDKSVYIEDANLSLMVANDDNFLYIYAYSADKMGFLRRGLTVWIDSSANDEKYFGLHFPIVYKNMEMRPMLNRKDDFENNTDRKRFDPLNDLIAGMDKFEILGEDKKDKKTFFLKENTPIKVALKDNQFYIAYEARVPLNKTENYKYSVDPGKDKTITLGFEFGELKSPNRGRGGMMREGGTPPGGGMMPPDGGGTGAGPGGGMDGRGGRGSRAGARAPEEMQAQDMDDFTIKVILK